MKPPMHVLVVSSEPYLIPTVPLGGIFQQHQVDALRAAGLRVGVASGGLLPLRDLFALGGRPLLERQGDTLVVRKFSKSVVPLRYRPEAQVHAVNVAQLVSAIETYIAHAGKPDCLHAHNLQYAGLAALEVSRRHGIALVLTEHSSTFVTDTFPPLLRPRFQEVLAHAAQVIAVSQSLATRLAQLFPGLPRPCTVVPNVVALDGTAAPALVQHVPFTFLNIGRLDANKNHELLLRAFSAAFRGAPVALRIGGSGAEQERLRALADSLGVTRQVSFLGFLERAQVAQELAQAHAFILPSLRETFGVVLIEALACGVPVIATPSGGPADIVDGANGILLPDHSVPAMAAALRAMHDDYGRFDRQAIRAAAIARFSAPAFSARMTGIYGAARAAASASGAAPAACA